MLFCAHPCAGSVGLRTQGPRPSSGGGHSILLPTKTSLLDSQLFSWMFGKFALTDRIGSQVGNTRLVDI